ncbi:sulfurtransferase complex subunit TusB [Thiohalobacter sp. IOR34]|uniref:sulfurtransferase complex subunit TusB n=1 Tax=Thiohalobacter sp. IOR34 TaxID=3057176 RepID=UPI0025B1AF62|nr:sulfurtransferase complex subunit TusB [Thiohalobacter sp. IOR34]WJW74345.1 sulfurtransferase complex subunit TusB [Thiohalobacter sp. IOR34]
MAMLHTVNKSPFENRSLDSCIAHAKPGSSILLIEDAVVGAVEGTAVSGKVKSAIEACKLYVLGPDLKARGIPEDRLIDGVGVVDYGGFVDLVTENDNVQAWL